MEELYIVTGAAGFLGSTIVRRLVEKNKRVRAFVLPNDKSVEYLPSNIEIVKGDLLDIDSLENLFKDSDKYITYVMHIASIVTVNPDYNQLVMDVNVKGTQNIIDMSIKYNIKRLLYCSSTGAIPELKKGKISETESFDENKVLGCYSKSKALATKLVLSYKDNYILGGISAGIGIIFIAIAYPLYSRIYKHLKNKYKDQIFELSEKILNDNGR